MLAGGDTGAAIYNSRRTELKKQKEEDEGRTGRTLKSFLANLKDG